MDAPILDTTPAVAPEPTFVRPEVAPARGTGRRLLAVACWGYLVAVILLCAFMRLQGDRTWLATFLLLAPRWPFLGPVVLLMPWALWARRWRAAGVVLTAAAVVVFPIMGFRVAIPATDPQRGDLRLMTFNVHRRHVDLPRLAAVIADVQPEVIAFQDWSAANEAPLFGGGGWHTRHLGELFVASRHPIGAVRPLDFADSEGVPKAERGAAAVFELRTPRGPVHLVNLHLASPHSALNTLTDDKGAELNRNALRRWGESDAVRSIVEGLSGPVILAGDFNTTDDSPIFREHWDGFTDAFLERGLGLGYTYLNDHTQFRIDHILADDTWRVIRCWVDAEAGSPHRPVVADLQLR